MKLLAPFAVATAMMVAGASTADAYSRSSSSAGPAGISRGSSGSGSCSGGRCASQQSYTSPRGTGTRSGTTSCAGGTCAGSATYTGAGGRTATRNRSFSR